MLSLEQENKENEKEYERLKAEAAIFTDISEKLSSLKKKLNRIGFSCDLSLGDETGEKTVDERTLEIKKAAEILGDLEEIIKDHDAKIRTEIATLSSEAKLFEDKIKSLEAGVMCYPEEATFVRDKINEELGEQSKIADAKLLCELL